jgi:uncharacterized protein (UPF0276 family)
MENIPSLGIGIGLRPFHFPEIFSSWPPIDWFEIISEHFLDGARANQLEQILAHYPVVMHGVTLAIGSSDPLDFVYLKQLKELARKTKTPWFSDHLAWGRLESSHYHDLLPLPFRKDVAEYVAERARIVQDFIEVPFALENVSSYASFTGAEMTEWEFYVSIAEKAGIGLMLDVNNVYVSSRNQGFDPEEYLNHIPLERVVQIHLAGHVDYGDYCLDTHDQRVRSEVWQLYAKVYPKTHCASTLLEWDDHYLSFEETWKEALKAKEFQRELIGV